MLDARCRIDDMKTQAVVLLVLGDPLLLAAASDVHGLVALVRGRPYHVLAKHDATRSWPWLSDHITSDDDGFLIEGLLVAHQLSFEL